jgi:uncharacterized protein (TIGR03086 family)
VTVHPAAAPLTAGVALLERALRYTLDSLVLVTPSALTRPTPCADWDLARLLDHMSDSLLALHEAVVGGRIALDPVHHPDEVPAVADLRARGCRLLADWRTAGAERISVSVGDRGLPPALVAAAGALEVAVHGWDVAAATGASRPLPAALAEPLLDLAPLLVTPADRGPRFGPERPVEGPASASKRLLAHLGRDGVHG